MMNITRKFRTAIRTAATTAVDVGLVTLGVGTTVAGAALKVATTSAHQAREKGQAAVDVVVDSVLSRKARQIVATAFQKTNAAWIPTHKWVRLPVIDALVQAFDNTLRGTGTWFDLHEELRQHRIALREERELLALWLGYQEDAISLLNEHFGLLDQADRRTFEVEWSVLDSERETVIERREAARLAIDMLERRLASL